MKKDIRTLEIKAISAFLIILMSPFLLKEIWRVFDGKPYERIGICICFAIALWISVKDIYTVFKSQKNNLE